MHLFGRKITRFAGRLSGSPVAVHRLSCGNEGAGIAGLWDRSPVTPKDPHVSGWAPAFLPADDQLDRQAARLRSLTGSASRTRGGRGRHGGGRGPIADDRSAPPPLDGYRSRMLDRLNARATALLADVFDFDVARRDPVEPVRLASGGALRAVAGDASGGTFFLCGNDDGPVLYAGSEGSAGILAADLDAAIRLVVGVPTWQDVVPLAPDLAAMRASFEASYAEMQEYEPRIDQLRAEAAAELGLDPVPLDELLTSLSVCLTELSPGYVLLNDDGDAYESL